jgi:Branched-chain amino acid transport system / permease component
VPAALPPASCTSAYFAPENASASNRANGPPQVVSTPILSALAPAAPAGVFVAAAAVVGGVAVALLDLPLEPQPASASAATASVPHAVQLRRRPLCAMSPPPQGVRDDPLRMRALGYNVRLHRTLGFAAGAFLAAVAGVLGTWHETRISPGTIDVSQTIQLLTIAVIGGLYRIEGAWIGALLYTLLDTYTRGLTGRFETWIGLILLAILVVSPDGVTGLAGQVLARVRRPAAKPSESRAQPAEPVAR